MTYQTIFVISDPVGIIRNIKRAASKFKTLMGKKEGEDENDVVEEVVVVDARLHPSARQVILLDEECNHFSVHRNQLLQCDHLHCKLVYVNCLQTY